MKTQTYEGTYREADWLRVEFCPATEWASAGPRPWREAIMPLPDGHFHSIKEGMKVPVEKATDEWFDQWGRLKLREVYCSCFLTAPDSLSYAFVRGPAAEHHALFLDFFERTGDRQMAKFHRNRLWEADCIEGLPDKLSRWAERDPDGVAALLEQFPAPIEPKDFFSPQPVRVKCVALLEQLSGKKDHGMVLSEEPEAVLWILATRDKANVALAFLRQEGAHWDQCLRLYATDASDEDEDDNRWRSVKRRA